jgi:DNA-binding MarR family transcriptional regulator
MSRHKRALFHELIEEVRRSQSATARFDEAVADALGMNRTDMRCVDVLQRRGRMTAGQLAEETGLSSGAMTAALDRLERSGYVRRVRDEGDRRRVLVELAPDAARGAMALYAEHATYAERLYRRHTVEQLELILRFVREGREFNERKAVALERQNQERRERAATTRAAATVAQHGEGQRADERGRAGREGPRAR